MSQTDSQHTQDLRQQIAELHRELDEVIAALPRHSVKASQILHIEELEDNIARLQAELGHQPDQSS